MNKPAKNIARTLALLLALSFGLSVADASLGDRDPGSRSWRTAPRHSAGIAPDPRKHTDIAIIGYDPGEFSRARKVTPDQERGLEQGGLY